MESILTTLSTHYVSSKDSLKSDFKIVDTNESDGYNLIHYNLDVINSTKPEDFLRRIRGLIIKDNKVLVESFGYTPTVVLSEAKLLKSENEDSKKFTLIDNDLQTHIVSDCEAYPLLDGTLLRVWKHNGVVNISTHKKLNASKSHWGSSQTFTELFLKYTKNYFNLEDLFNDENLESDKVVCHNFLLVDSDLLICSQVNLGEKSGFVLYINSVNGSLPESVVPKVVSVYDVKSSNDTFFKMESLKTLEEQNKFIKYGFHSDESKEDFGSSGEGIILFQDDRMIKVVSQDYAKRSVYVNNDPNVIHRAWTIMTESMVPKSGEDNYLSKFSILPTPSSDELQSIIDSKDLSILKSCKILSEDNFILKNNVETRNLRLLNSLIHYSMSLPVSHKVSALSCYETILKNKSEVIKMLCNDTDKYDSGLWGKPNPRDLKVFERIQTIVKEAKKYAKTRYSNGERIESMNEKQLLKKFTKENIRNLINKEYGENMYKIVRVLITSQSKVVSDE